MQVKVIAIAGRPNVGKSTLFNRWVGRRKSLVHREAGMTRDRLSEDMGFYELIDTGGLEFLSRDELSDNIREQAWCAMEDATLILFVVDGSAGLHPFDAELSQRLHRLNRPVFLVVNKLDTRRAQENLHEFRTLGWDSTFAVSSEHGTGVEDLKEKAVEFIGEDETEEKDVSPPRIALFGKPNVGKSSLINLIVGKKRVTESATPGTTRDSIEIPVEHDGHPYTFIDTAGFRRKSRVTEEQEKLSVIMGMKNMDRADICCMMVDLSQPITHQDLDVAKEIRDSVKGVLIIGNKTDLLPDHVTMDEVRDYLGSKFSFLHDAPICLLSARTGKHLGRLFKDLDTVIGSYRDRITTGELNRLFRSVIDRYPGKRRKFYYISQVSTAPPTFLVVSNQSGKLHVSFERFLEHRIRGEHSFPGVPLLFRVKKRGKKP